MSLVPYSRRHLRDSDLSVFRGAALAFLRTEWKPIENAYSLCKFTRQFTTDHNLHFSALFDLIEATAFGDDRGMHSFAVEEGRGAFSRKNLEIFVLNLE